MDSPTPAPTQNVPSTDSEIQLYRALERANLLQYYDNFISQGGDDLQQLCEAEEGEFFEIMELVGMSSKPLHVRRLQKVLQEFIADPGQFQAAQASPISEPSKAPQVATNYSVNVPNSSIGSSSPGNDGLNPAANKTFASLAGLSQYSRMTFSPKFSQAKNPVVNGENATLSEEHVINVRNAALAIFQEMDMQAFPLPKKIPQEMVHILEMAGDHPQREEEIRKWAPIYGRFDSKRKSEKPLSLHEVTVNEAACQLCLLEPNLLFMRDRLFPLARQVVRESGYQYKHGHSSRSNRDIVRMQGEEEGPLNKRQKISRDADLNPNPRTVQAEIMKLRREERMNEITSQLSVIKEKQATLKDNIAGAKVEENLQKVYDLQIELEKLTSQQLMLMTEQTDLIKRQRRSDRYYGAKAKQTEDDVRSEGAYNSNETSPQPQEFKMEQPYIAECSATTNGTYTSQIVDSYQTSMNHGEGGSSPKPDTSRVSRRKGTPRSHQAILKQTLMEEGLRLAQVFNSGGDDFNDSVGDSEAEQQGYRIDPDDAELRQAYGIKDLPPNVNVANMNSEDVTMKQEHLNVGTENGNSGQVHFVAEGQSMEEMTLKTELQA
ncbi:NGFI-A-binding protein 1 [Holothuria leucospilota]|uniref:NGFI-A-binding protein 1 n=1 Tax=Holothuria leucospilota TaxID=206669 RepID=A0A9Q1H773_HOLLE|nr:NGFI-A-binding protein 1 [Holothuria leucospilota]